MAQADVRVSQLLSGGLTLTTNDIFLIVQAGDSKRVTLGEILSFAAENLAYYYKRVMIADEVFDYVASSKSVCLLDPNGTDRNFNPSTDFYDGYEIVIINCGNGGIVFDSGGIAKTVASGQKESFFYDSILGWH
jgi:ABC-type lipopolysaccharide export system ATPase subunit